ncbi:MAG: HAD domain-containing protein [Firmicutes bacterium]|nr:HAD domain-containing protein [Bacillota bacterium]
MKKIIFLDIFGVLATPKSGANLDEDCFAKLLEILRKTKASIVLTTSFRRSESFLSRFKKGLQDEGICQSCVFDATPDLKHIEKWNSNEELRAKEIQKYIEENDVKNYVIIDDMDLKPYLEDEININFVRCETHIGLTNERADKCFEVLK